MVQDNGIILASPAFSPDVTKEMKGLINRATRRKSP